VLNCQRANMRVMFRTAEPIIDEGLPQDREAGTDADGPEPEHSEEANAAA